MSSFKTRVTKQQIVYDPDVEREKEDARKKKEAEERKEKLDREEAAKKAKKKASDSQENEE